MRHRVKKSKFSVCVCRAYWFSVILDDRNDLWIDDEGLLHNPQPPKFQLTGYPRPLAGNAVIAGYTDSGKMTHTRYKADQIRPHIHFLGDISIEPSLEFHPADVSSTGTPGVPPSDRTAGNQ